MHPQLRTIVHYGKYRLIRHWRSYVELGLLFLSVAVALFAPLDVYALVGYVGIAVSAALIVLDYLAWRRRYRDVRLVPNPEWADRVRGLVLPDGQERLVLGSQVAVFDRSVNRALGTGGAGIDLARQQYRPPGVVRDYTSLAINRRRADFNQRKVRLAGDVTAEDLRGQHGLRLQPTDYFSSVATNEVSDCRFEYVDSARKSKPLVAFDMSELVFDDDGALVPLSQSLLSNHIGVTTVVLTADHRIVLQEQGDQSIDSYMLTVGASGSMDLADVRRQADLQAALRRAMEREAGEELSAQFAGPQHRTFLTGFARYVHRGGKPEFFGLSCSSSDSRSLAPARHEEKYVHRIFFEPYEPTVEGLAAALGALRDRITESRASISMLAGIEFAVHHLAANPEQLRRTARLLG